MLTTPRGFDEQDRSLGVGAWAVLDAGRYDIEFASTSPSRNWIVNCPLMIANALCWRFRHSRAVVTAAAVLGCTWALVLTGHLTSRIRAGHHSRTGVDLTSVMLTSATLCPWPVRVTGSRLTNPGVCARRSVINANQTIRSLGNLIWTSLST